MTEAVRVIIPTYNGMKWLGDCLSALTTTDYASMTIEVIDNASVDGSADFIEEHYEQVSVLRLDDNVGFARAVNLGVHRALEAHVDNIVLLNQDTRVKAGWLKELVSRASSEELGIASPLQLNYEGTAIEAAFAELLAWHGYDPEQLVGPVVSTDWVIGAAMMVRAEVFRAIGSFDENYFFYGEELDLCRRAVAGGFKVGVVTTSVVCHHEGKVKAEGGTGRSFHRLLGDYIYRLKSPARPLVWLLGRWACQFVRDVCRGIVGHHRAFLWQLLLVQWSLLKKLPGIIRRRRQERCCPHALW